MQRQGVWLAFLFSDVVPANPQADGHQRQNGVILQTARSIRGPSEGPLRDRAGTSLALPPGPEPNNRE